MVLDNKYYSASPAGLNADNLFKEYRNLMLLNLVGFLRSVQNALPLDISLIIDKYEKLSTKKKFSPAIFSLCSQIVQVANQGNVPSIIELMHKFKILKLEEILDSKFRLSSILTESWESDFVNTIRNEHIPNKNGEHTLILPIISPNLIQYEMEFKNLKDHIKRIDFDFFQELETYVTRLKLFNGKALKAATSASVFGAIYLKIPPSNENQNHYFFEHIIHETSHLQLDILLAFDKIILNDEVELFKSPIRVDPRPMFGIFHATFVLSRMVRLFQRIIKENKNNELIDRLDIFRKQFEEGLKTIELQAVLTENGKRIKDTLILTAEI